METYFADTAFWIALSSKRDQHHAPALAWYRFLIREKALIVTTEAVLWEWLNAVSPASTRGLAAEGYRRAHADRQIEVAPFERSVIDAAVALYRAREDKNWSLTDCLSFIVMDRRGIQAALTTDQHFAQANLRPLLLGPPPPFSDC